MKKLFLLIGFLLMTFPFMGKAQNALQQEWVKAIGGTGHLGLQSLEFAENRPLISGCIFAADTALGCANCTANGNALLLVADSNGNKIYSHCYGGSAENDFQSACFGKDGNIWAIGFFNSTNGDFPDTTGKAIAVVKFDSIYNPIWYNFYGSDGENDFGDFITTSDGGALILASTNDTSGDIHYLYGNNPFNFDTYLCKLDSAGNIKWLLILGGSGDQTGEKLRELEPGIYSVLINTNSVDYMLTGLNFDTTYSSPWLLKIDTGGHILSSRIAPNLNFVPKDFMSTKQGGLLLAGSIEPLTDSNICYPGLGLSDIALVALDSAYQKLWCKTMGGSDNDYFYYMAVINDSVVALCGISQSIDGGLVRCSSFGDGVYHGWLGLVNTSTQELTWQTSFCCSQDVTMLGISYDSTGQSLYVLMSAGVDGDFASAAINGTTNNTYLFKYDLITTTGITELSKTNSALSLYPNPASSECILKIDEPYQMSNVSIFDAVGRQVMPLFNGQQLSSFNINCNSLSPGLYFVRVTDTEGSVGVMKMVKE